MEPPLLTCTSGWPPAKSVSLLHSTVFFLSHSAPQCPRSLTTLPGPVLTHAVSEKAQPSALSGPHIAACP